MNINEQKLNEILSKKIEFDEKFYKFAFNRWQSIAKPLGGLGVLENIVCQIAKIQKTQSPKIEKKALAIFCSDNGIVAENISQTDSSVTKIVYENMKKGESSVCKMAKVAKCDVFPFDVGINPNGTKDFLHEDAMTREECCSAILKGIEIAEKLSSDYDIFSTGEMGIGNTTTSSAVLSACLSINPASVTGKGAGLSDSGLLHKIEVIKQGIENRKPNKNDVIDVLSKVGGFDICAMCGFFIGGAIFGKPVLIDGFISSVSALCAVKLFPQTKNVLIPSHVSTELAGKIVLDALELNAIVHAGMHLGEGTGCMTLLPMLDMAFEVFYKMPTFDDIKIEAYKPFEK